MLLCDSLILLYQEFVTRMPRELGRPLPKCFRAGARITPGYCWRTPLQSSKSIFSRKSFPSFCACKEGMWGTHISALLSSPTVSARLFDEVWEEIRSCRKLARALLMYYKHSQAQEACAAGESVTHAVSVKESPREARREEIRMGIIGWIIFGLIVGAVAKLLMPGRDPGGWIVTILLGIAGALVGGFLGRAVGWYGPNDAAGFLMALVGALVLLGLYRLTLRRPT